MMSRCLKVTDCVVLTCQCTWTKQVKIEIKFVHFLISDNAERRVIERERLQHELNEYDDKLNRQVEGKAFFVLGKVKIMTKFCAKECICMVCIQGSTIFLFPSLTLSDRLYLKDLYFWFKELSMLEIFLIFYGSQRLEVKFRLAAMFYMSRSFINVVEMNVSVVVF